MQQFPSLLRCTDGQLSLHSQASKAHDDVRATLHARARHVYRACEIKPTALQTFYTVDDINETLRLLHNADDAYRLTPNIIEGEKKRIAQGGRPIYNPTIGMVATHYDIFKDIYEQQHIMNEKADRALAELKALRAKLDPIIVDIWNQVEAHFAELPPETRFDECRKYGLIYYYRTGEKKPE